MNTIREKIKKNQPLACAFLRMPEPSSAEIMAVNGIDLIVIDWEHYQHNSETMVNIVRAADAYGTACLVRVADVRPAVIGRLMDMGAAGIMLADAQDAQQIKELVDAVKYYPVGHRGVSTDSRAGKYGHLISDSTQYGEIVNQATVIAAIIETKSAVDDLENILSIPELDIVSVGTADLSYALGCPGQSNHPDLLRCKENVYRKILSSGKMALDKSFTEEDLRDRYNAGIRCFYVGSDMSILNKGLWEAVTPLRKIKLM